RTVAVVRRTLDQEQRAGRPSPFVKHFLVRHSLDLTSTALDGAVDGVVWHLVAFGVCDRLAQPSIRRGITTAIPSSDHDLANQLREELAARSVDGALLALNRGPFGMPAHSTHLSHRDSKKGRSTTTFGAARKDLASPTPHPTETSAAGSPVLASRPLNDRPQTKEPRHSPGSHRAKKRPRTSTGVTPPAPQAGASAIPPPSRKHHQTGE